MILDHNHPDYVEIQPVLVCSTGMLTRETCDWLMTDPSDGPAVLRWEYGPEVYCSHDDHDISYPRADLRAVIEAVNSRYPKVTWIRFDADALPLPESWGLPTYEW